MMKTATILQKFKYISNLKLRRMLKNRSIFFYVMKGGTMQIINNIRLIKHSVKVAFFSYFAAKRMRLSRLQCRNIFFAGLLHDIGKIKLNQHILYKKNKLTIDEYEYIKQHVILGTELLRKYRIPEVIINVVEQHHEREDGTGYPNGLGDNEICVEAKIIRRADVYDALTSNRSYRKKYSREKAREIMVKEEII